MCTIADCGTCLICLWLANRLHVGILADPSWHAHPPPDFNPVCELNKAASLILSIVMIRFDHLNSTVLAQFPQPSPDFPKMFLARVKQLSISIHIWIYVERERETERGRGSEREREIAQYSSQSPQLHSWATPRWHQRPLGTKGIIHRDHLHEAVLHLGLAGK